MSGVEWLVDARGCQAGALCDPGTMTTAFEAIVSSASLRPIGRPVFHQFPAPGGLTMVWMLQESHLTVHTFPEFGAASLNLFCCTPRPCPDWRALLGQALGATDVRVAECVRTYGSI